MDVPIGWSIQSPEEERIATQEHACTYNICKKCNHCYRIELHRSSFWKPICQNWGFNSELDPRPYGPDKDTCPYYLDHQLVKKKYVIVNQASFEILIRDFHIELPFNPCMPIVLTRVGTGEERRMLMQHRGQAIKLDWEGEAWGWYEGLRKACGKYKRKGKKNGS
jgi:hypothetical protein